MTPENIPELIFGEMGAALKSMNRAGSLEEKLTYSQIVRNLSESLEVFMTFMDLLNEEEVEE